MPSLLFSMLPWIGLHPDLLWIPATLHCIIGLVAAAVAQRRGFPAGKWLLWGLIGGTVALVSALLMTPPGKTPEA